MLVQSTQSRKSWKSRSRLVEIDTVDFLFRRLIYTCTCTGKFRIYIAARNSRPVPYQKVIKVYVQIPPQSATNTTIYITSTFASLCLSWDRNPYDSFSLAICLHPIFILSLFLNYLSPLGNHGKLPSLFYRRERYRYRNDGHEQEYLYYSTYSDLLVFLSSLKFRRGRSRSR